MWLFFAFLAVPLIEIALFVQIGGAIGLWPTLGIVVATAALGTWLVRGQGLLALDQLRGSLNNLRDPTEPLAHGAMILFSGALLLTPGFFTDAVGFLLLVPGVRSALFNAIRKRIRVHQFQYRGDGDTDPMRPASDDVIDGEFEEVSAPKRPTHQSSGWTRH